jgi:hypothetical protein
MSNYKKYKSISIIRVKIIFLFLFITGLLFTISCKPKKKTFAEILKEKSDSLNLLKTTYNPNYFKDTVNVHYVVRANFIGGKIEILAPVYRVPGKFFNVYQGSGDFIVKLLDQSRNVISSYTTLPPNLIISHESVNDSIVHSMGRVKFDLSFPADSNIKFIGFNYIKNLIDTTIGVPDSIAVIQ